MPTVYIVQNQMRRSTTSGKLEPAFDLAPAREYGNLSFLLDSGPTPMIADAMIEELDAKLENYDRDTDYLLAVGNPVAISAAAAIVAFNCDGRVRMLVWDRIVRKYNVVNIDIHKGLRRSIINTSNMLAGKV